MYVCVYVGMGDLFSLIVNSSKRKDYAETRRPYRCRGVMHVAFVRRDNIPQRISDRRVYSLRIVCQFVYLAGDVNFQRECLDAHNALRQKYGCNPLIWSQELADLAHTWAEKLSMTGRILYPELAGNSTAPAKLFSRSSTHSSPWHSMGGRLRRASCPLPLYKCVTCQPY